MKRGLNWGIGAKCIFSFLALLGSTSLASWQPIGESSKTAFYFELAQFHAPILFQQVGANPVADTITRVDFDGDLVANNNWDNLDKFSTPGFVYYSVIETETDYFINYALYHARDYSNICFQWHCHENDLEGLTLTVYKDGSTYGTVRLLETLAHNTIYTYKQVPFVEVPQSNGTIKKVAIFVERQGHGVRGWDAKKQGALSGEVIVSGNRRLSSKGTEGEIKSVYGNRERALQNFLVYYGGGKADLPPQGARQGEYSYQLLSTETELWNRQNLMGKGSLWVNPWDYQGVRGFVVKGVAGGFAGEKYGLGRANPPWAWFDDGESVLKRGDWFFDPAHYTSSRMKLKDPMSLKYIYNPFIK